MSGDHTMLRDWRGGGGGRGGGSAVGYGVFYPHTHVNSVLHKDTKTADGDEKKKKKANCEIKK